MKMNFKVIVFLLILPFAVFSNSALDLLRKMNKVYLNANSYSMKISVTAFELSSGTKPQLNYSGEVKKSENCYYSFFAGRKTIINKDYSVLIDDNNKVISVGIANKKGKNEFLMSFIDNDSLFEGGFKYELKGTKDNIATIEIIATEPEFWEYKKIEISVDINKNTFEQMIIYPKVNSAVPEEGNYEKIVIKYSNIKINQAISSSDFSEKKVVKISQTKISPSEKYNGYRIINQLTTKKKSDL